MGLLKSTKDSLAEEFARHPKLAPLRDNPRWSTYFITDPKLWKKELDAFSADRASAADLASAGATLFAGWAIFGNGALGALDMGDRYARRMAHHNAASHFFLGRKVGNVFYNIFPQEPSHFQVFEATATVLLGVSILSLIIHAVIDPVHQSVGLHRKKMTDFVDALEQRLLLNVRTRMSEMLLAGGTTTSPERPRESVSPANPGAFGQPALE
jgi:hypothetical protein